jgi:hypothetical protein
MEQTSMLHIPAKICLSIKVYNSVTWLADTSQLVHPKAFIPLCSLQVEVKLYGPKFTTLQSFTLTYLIWRVLEEF